MSLQLARNEELVNGQVLRVLRDTGDVIVEVLRLECRLPKSQMIPRETLKAGDRVQALIKDINNEATGQPVILTRISPRFLTLLFQRVVPEIEKGILVQAESPTLLHAINNRFLRSYSARI